MENHYLNREQSEAKHEILARYLIPFANKILRTWDSLDFIDAFSGPWNNRDKDNLSDTSIGISLKILQSVARKLDHSPSNKKVRCIFNECNPKSYNLLREFVDSNKHRYPLLKIETFQGKFTDNADIIKKSANHTFQLLFIDPTGYTGLPPDTIAKFKGRSSEVIINFMRSFINRFATNNHEHAENSLISLLGNERAQRLLSKEISIEEIEDEYLNMLRRDLGFKYAGHSQIHNPNKDEINFNLTYATHHFEGMEVMRSTEYKALSEYDKKRFEKKQSTDQLPLFGDLTIEGPYLRTRKEHLQKAPEIIKRALEEQKKGIKFSMLCGDIQQSLFLKRSELGDVIVEMSEQGLIANSWKARNSKARKPNISDVIALKK